VRLLSQPGGHGDRLVSKCYAFLGFYGCTEHLSAPWDNFAFYHPLLRLWVLSGHLQDVPACGCLWLVPRGARVMGFSVVPDAESIREPVLCKASHILGWTW
jgi:hypothetical protein